MSNVRTFIKHVAKTCKNHDVEFTISKHKILDAKTDCPVVGYFDNGDHRRLKVARGSNPEELWVSVLVHEYSHLEQEIKKDPTFNTDIKDEAAEFILEEYIANKKRLSRQALGKVLAKIIRNEHNCEIRSIKNINKFKLPINRKEYIKQANSYLFSYYYIQDHKIWISGHDAVWKQEFIVDNMPDYFLPFDEYKKEYKKLRYLFDFVYQGC